MNIQRDYDLKTVVASDEGRSIFTEINPRQTMTALVYLPPSTLNRCPYKHPPMTRGSGGLLALSR